MSEDNEYINKTFLMNIIEREKPIIESDNIDYII